MFHGSAEIILGDEATVHFLVLLITFSGIFRKIYLCSPSSNYELLGVNKSIYLLGGLGRVLLFDSFGHVCS